MKVGNSHGDMIYAHRAIGFLLRVRLCGIRQGGNGKYELPSGEFAALKLVQHHFYGLDHGNLRFV